MKATAAVLSGKNQVYIKEVDLPEIGEEELLDKIVSTVYVFPHTKQRSEEEIINEFRMM